MSVSTFLEIALYRPVTQRFFPPSTESHRWETGRYPAALVQVLQYNFFLFTSPAEHLHLQVLKLQRLNLDLT